MIKNLPKSLINKGLKNIIEKEATRFSESIKFITNL